MKVLITGGAGYIGSILAADLLAAGYGVTVLDNFMYRQNSLLDCCAHEKFSVIRGDCRDATLLKETIKGQDIIVPLAALVGAAVCDADTTAARSTNLAAVESLLALRSQQQRILFPNTNSGYGVGEQGQHCTEESPLNPLSLYGRTKVEAERAIMDAGNALCFRLATVFGISPRMRMDLLVNDFVYRALTDRTVVIFEGHFMRNYIHVRDVSRAFLHGIKHYDQMAGEVYNVGLDEANFSKLELCGKIKEHLPDFVYLEAPIGEDPDKRDYIVSNEKITHAGFAPAHSLDAGISELIKGYSILRNAQYVNS